MNSERSVIAYRIGVVVRGVVLGVLLIEAVLALLALTSGAELFRYQGF